MSPSIASGHAHTAELRASVSAELRASLQEVADRAAAALGDARCSLHLLDRDDALHTVVVSGIHMDTLRETIFPKGWGIAGWVVQTLHPLIVRDVAKEPHFISLDREPTGAIMCVPILHESVCYGTLTARSDNHDAFDRQALVLLESYAFSAAFAMIHASGHTIHEAEIRSEATFDTVTRMLAISEDPRRSLETVMPLLFDIVPYDVGVLLVQDEDGSLDVAMYERHARLHEQAAIIRAWAYDAYQRQTNEEDRAFGLLPATETVAGNSLCVIPLNADDQRVGLAVFARSTPFDLPTRQLLHRYGGVIAKATATDHQPRASASEDARYSAMFAHLSDGLLLLDQAGTVALEANAAFFRLTGIPREQVVFPVKMAALASYWNGRAEPILGGDPMIVGSWHIRPAPGQSHHLEMRDSIIVINDEPRRLRTFHDVTAAYHMKQADAELMSVVSHELKTPLTSVYGFLDMLAKGRLGRLSDTQQSFLLTAILGVRQLGYLVDDIRELSQANLARLSLQRTAMRIEALLAEVIATMEPWLTDAELRIDTTIAPAPPTILADPVRIRQVITNLLMNAINYSQPGSAIHVEATHDSASLIVRISDTGPGIAQEDRDRIFRRFEQAAPPSRTAGGLGLGLAIVQEIVDMHGGRVWVESTVGNGSTFVFTLPITPHGKD